MKRKNSRPKLDSPLRILHVIPSLHAGGAERVVLELCARSKAPNVEVSVMALFDAGPLLVEFEQRGVDVEVLRGHSWPNAFRAVWRRVRMEHPDVIHTHLFGADVIGRLVGFFAGVPVRVTTEHNINFDYSIAKRLVNRVLSLITTKYISVSAVAKKHLCDRQGVSPSRVIVIENGINLSRVRVRGPQLFHDVPRLMSVGRLSHQKGFDILFRALAGLRRPWMLDLVGTGPDERMLKYLAEELHIAGRVRFLGFVADVPERLADADVFCMPSRYEGLGLAFIEAASAGIPIVASDLNVFHEILSPDEALFVPVGDVLGFRRMIDQLLGAPSSMVAISARCAPFVREQFDANRMTKRYVTLYRELLKR